MSAVERLLPILRDVWGYDAFRPLQDLAAGAVLDGRDALVVMPTGAGKSLCFQAPALLRGGVTLVVSPLISLMKDQVDGLRELDIPAGKLHSGQSADEARAVAGALRRGELRLLYVSPERMMLTGFDRVAQGARVASLVIDEAHCISEWGHDFRPEYRQLAGFRETHPDIPIHAFTATATPRVADDIVRQLALKNPERIVGSFDRPNLYYAAERQDDVAGQLARIARRHRGEAGIVYCISRKDTERLAEALSSRGVRALPYHAGLDEATRARTQDSFINDEVAVIVATVAFGMGIDKPDVRWVAHAGLSKSIENYQQESGRAGRDGLGAECILLHSPGDRIKWDFVLKSLEGDAYHRAKAKLGDVHAYASSSECRRRVLLAYFGEAYPDDECGACDVCAEKVARRRRGGAAPAASPPAAPRREVRRERVVEPIAAPAIAAPADLLLAPEEALVVGQKILSCVKRLGEAQGPGYTARVLVGASDQRIAEAGHDKLSTYGILRDVDRSQVRLWIDALSAQGFLSAAPGEHARPVLRLTESGWNLIRGKAWPQLLREDPVPLPAARATAGAGAGEEFDDDLFEHLRALRRAIALEKKLPPYMIFGDRTLRELARLAPTTATEFRAVHGVGDAKLAHYGEAFVRAIVEFTRR